MFVLNILLFIIHSTVVMQKNCSLLSICHNRHLAHYYSCDSCNDQECFLSVLIIILFTVAFMTVAMKKNCICLTVLNILLLIIILVTAAIKKSCVCLTVCLFVCLFVCCFIFAFPSYISGIHHFWVRFLRM